MVRGTPDPFSLFFSNINVILWDYFNPQSLCFLLCLAMMNPYVECIVYIFFVSVGEDLSLSLSVFPICIH